MVRDWKRQVAGEGVWVPRSVLLLLLGVLVALVFYKIYAPPKWLIQRLDSPDGKKKALLKRVAYDHLNYSVHLKDGWRWNTIFLSPSFTNDYRIDLQERIRWSPDSRYLFFDIQNKPIWGYDVTNRTALKRIPE